MVWKVVRRLLALFIRGFVVHPMVGLAVVVGILGVAGVGLMANGLDTTRLMQGQVTSDSVGAAPVANAPTLTTSQAVAPAAPPPAVNEYLQGMIKFDASKEWDSFDPTTIQAMTSQGASVQVLQQRLDEVKQSGAQFEDVTFVGGYPLKNGNQYFFYVVSRRGFAGPGQFDQVFYVFTVGPSGKIVKIE